MYGFRYYAAVIATSLLLISSLTTEVRAQAYPTKPVRMVLPFPAGAPSDIVGRTSGQSQQMGELLRTETARYAAIIKSAGLRPH